MSLQAEKQESAAYDDANWQIEARETAARINNDIQQLMATAEAVFLRWAEDGLLDQTHRVTQFDHSVNRYVTEQLPRRSALEASARFAGMVREVAMDALSPSAQEAMDVSRG